MEEIVNKLLAPGKGILATDATPETMDKRMKAIGIEPNELLRKEFRKVLLTTPNFGQYISGVILNDEVLEFAEILKQKGVLVGIKVDKKCWPLANFPGEKIAEGLDGLRDRLIFYKEKGCSFTKFRSVITIGKDIPTRVCIDSNAFVLARYAALVCEQGMVPIIEPEVVMDGDHDSDRCAQVTALTLKSVFYHLNEQKVDIKNVILKINMALPGKDSPEVITDEIVAQKTLEALKRSVPENLPGIVFLSGGQKADDATKRLSVISKLNDTSWKISFSFERALEGPAMEVWMGKEENIKLAQDKFLERAKENATAISR